MDSLDLVDYSRQEEMDNELDHNLDRRIAVVGCGGVGSWLAILLAMTGYRNITLRDGQKIEASNLNRLPVPQTWIGKNKAIALRKVIKYLRPDTNISVIPFHVTDEAGFNRFLAQNVHMVYDCTDDARIQQKITAWTRTAHKRYRKIGYEGYKLGTYRRMDDIWIDDSEYRAGYRTSRANAVSSALAGGIGLLSEWLEADDTTVDMKELLKGEAHGN
jgi:molybdopterin/thiamine biosynthesis adenylyltransferase